MKYNIHHIPETGISLNFSESPKTFHVLKEMEQNKECVFITPVNILAHLGPIADMFRLEGRFDVMLRIPCSRCLNEFDLPVCDAFSLVFQSKANAPTNNREEEIELQSEDLDIIIFSDDEIDIQEALQEQIVLSIPMKPVCHEACKGICVMCGTDLNREKCHCASQKIDPRFAALQTLKLSDLCG